MKTYLLLSLITPLLFILPAHAAEIIDQKITWEGSMPAKTHNGTIDVKSLDVNLDGGRPTVLKVVLDMTTLTNTDIKKEKDRTKLEKHLKSEDFFYVSKHPEASFTLKEWEDGQATGVLSIRGVDVEKTIPLTLTKTEEGNWTLKGDFTFDRQKFNVNYQNSGIFGVAKNKIIGDEVDVGVQITFKN